MSIVVRPTLYDTNDLIKEAPIVVDDVTLTKDDTYFMFGRYFDKNSVIVTLLSFILINIIYVYFKFFQNGLDHPDVIAVYAVYIIFLVGRLVMESDKYGGFVYEQESLYTTEQMNSLLLGSLVVIIYFGKENVGHRKLLLLSLGLLLLNTLNIAVAEDGDDIKTIRSVKEGVLNLAVFLIVCSTVMEYNGVQ